LDHVESIVLATIRDRAPQYDGDLLLDTPLGPEGVGLDSIAILELILELEALTGTRLRDEDLTFESVATPRGLIGHLARKQGDQG
jgi:acyl carrier protein